MENMEIVREELVELVGEEESVRLVVDQLGKSSQSEEGKDKTEEAKDT